MKPRPKLLDPCKRCGTVDIDHDPSSFICLLASAEKTFRNVSYVYAPYVPLQLFQLQTEDREETIRDRYFRRFSTASISSKFYGLLDIV